MPKTLTKKNIEITAKPFLKWAGGKAKLVPEILSLMTKQAEKWDNFTYIEPFVGGGAVLFAVLKHFPNINKVIINDINPHLVTSYQVIKETPELLINNLRSLQSEYYNLPNIDIKTQFFLDKRIEFNHCHDPLMKTVLLLFLNKTCFNGLYRVNSKGLFNVPFGKYEQPTICNEQNLIAVHKILRKVKILQGDFTQTVSYSENNSLFYFDPPYKPIKTTSAFTSYTKEDFNDEDQIRLKQFCDQINESGYKFILSNSDVKNFDAENNFFDDLYQNYVINRVKARRNINSKGDGRGKIFELMITNIY